MRLISRDLCGFDWQSSWLKWVYDQWEVTFSIRIYLLNLIWRQGVGKVARMGLLKVINVFHLQAWAEVQLASDNRRFFFDQSSRWAFRLRLWTNWPASGRKFFYCPDELLLCLINQLQFTAICATRFRVEVDNHLVTLFLQLFCRLVR